MGANADVEKLHTFCKQLPKIELHAHLNGSIREHTLVELAKERNVTLPNHFLLHEAEHHDPDREATFFNTKPRSLQECFEIFTYIPKCVNDLVALRRITEEALLDAAHDNVAYIEIRTGPKVLLHDHSSAEAEHCTKQQYVETIIDVMKAFERKEHLTYEQEMKNNKDTQLIRLPLIPRLIVSVDRSGTLDQALENIELAIGMHRVNTKHVVGVELGGNPTRNNFRLFEPAFAKARRAGLPVAIHCGEVQMASANTSGDDPALQKSYDEAASIIRFGPDRLGHALLLSDSLMDTLVRREQPIPIECCPTSNIMTLELALHHGGNLIDGMKAHPQLGKWLAKGYPISLNTDDSGLFCTNLTKEYLLVAQAFQLEEREVADIALNSIEHVFDTDAKSRLREDVNSRIEELLQ